MSKNRVDLEWMQPSKTHISCFDISHIVLSWRVKHIDTNATWL